MTEENALEKTNRVNLLFDFYEKLLTEKQQLFLKLYFHDDYSLGEIASEFSISRQAVYEHIKRAATVLEEYEAKLLLFARHEERMGILQHLQHLADEFPASTRTEVKTLMQRLYELE